MIETNYFILTQEQYQEYNPEAQRLGISLDYLMMEFLDIEGPNVVYDGENWVEVNSNTKGD